MVLSFQLQKRKWTILTQSYLHQKATLKFFTRCLFLCTDNLILIISYSTCVIIVCLCKLQDVVEAIRTNIPRVFNKKWKLRRSMKRRMYNEEYNERSDPIFLHFLYSFVLAMCRVILDCCPLTLGGSEIAMKNTTWRISQTIMVSLWNVSYMKDAGHTYVRTTMHFEASCLRDQHFLNNARARERVTLCNVNLAVISSDC